MKLFSSFICQKRSSSKRLALFSSIIGLVATIGGCNEDSTNDAPTLYGCPNCSASNHEECVAEYEKYPKILELCDTMGIGVVKNNIKDCCKDTVDYEDWCKDYIQSGVCADAEEPEISTKYGMPSSPIDPNN